MKFLELKDKTITFEYKNKSYSRKINKNKEFKFNKETYFYYSTFNMGYGRTNKIYLIDTNMKNFVHRFDYGWAGLNDFISLLTTKYKPLETNAISTPSAPNTSKFSATKSGFIRALEQPSTYGQTQYSCGTYFHKAIQIGGNVSNIEELLKDLRYVMPKLASQLDYNNDDKIIRYDESLGTSFSTFGVG